MGAGGGIDTEHCKVAQEKNFKNTTFQSFYLTQDPVINFFFNFYTQTWVKKKTKSDTYLA